MSQSVWNICVCQSFYSECKLIHEILFIEQHINIVNTVTHQSVLFNCTYISSCFCIQRFSPTCEFRTQKDQILADSNLQHVKGKTGRNRYKAVSNVFTLFII